MLRFWPALIVLPILEIIVFILIIDTIGIWITLLLVLLSSLAGIVMLRKQRNVRWLQAAFRETGVLLQKGPNRFLAFLGAFLLIVPGFICDCIGLVLLWPYTRKKIASKVAFNIKTPSARQTYDVEGVAYEELDVILIDQTDRSDRTQ
jgi:UPF0716 protein FxsA